MRKIIRAFKKSTNNCIKALTGFDFFEPTITKQIKGSYKKTLKFLKKKLKTIYLKYTNPKRVKNDKCLKNIKNIKEKNKMKKQLLEKYFQDIKDLMEKEKNEPVKRTTALLNLTLLDYFKIFLGYGYKNKDGNIRTKKEITIAENKYGIQTIQLEEFKTYKEIKNKFSSKIKKQKYYRRCLINLIRGKIIFNFFISFKFL